MNPKYIVLVTDTTTLISKTPVCGLILDLYCGKVLTLQVPQKAENFLSSLRNYQLLKIGCSMEFIT
jgi:hypothetical protein